MKFWSKLPMPVRVVIEMLIMVGIILIGLYVGAMIKEQGIPDIQHYSQGENWEALDN